MRMNRIYRDGVDDQLGKGRHDYFLVVDIECRLKKVNHEGGLL